MPLAVAPYRACAWNLRKEVPLAGVAARAQWGRRSSAEAGPGEATLIPRYDFSSSIPGAIEQSHRENPAKQSVGSSYRPIICPHLALPIPHPVPISHLQWFAWQDRVGDQTTDRKDAPIRRRGRPGENLDAGLPCLPGQRR
jgi:hypothetical protein